LAIWTARHGAVRGLLSRGAEHRGRQQNREGKEEVVDRKGRDRGREDGEGSAAAAVADDDDLRYLGRK